MSAKCGNYWAKKETQNKNTVAHNLRSVSVIVNSWDLTAASALREYGIAVAVGVRLRSEREEVYVYEG